MPCFRALCVFPLCDDKLIKTYILLPEYGFSVRYDLGRDAVSTLPHKVQPTAATRTCLNHTCVERLIDFQDSIKVQVKYRIRRTLMRILHVGAVPWK